VHVDYKQKHFLAVKVGICETNKKARGTLILFTKIRKLWPPGPNEFRLSVLWLGMEV
jgi:hypothetical protein